MPEPYSLLSFATMGESHGVGSGAAGLGGAAAGLAAPGAPGAAAVGFGGVAGTSGRLVGRSLGFRLNRSGGSSFHSARRSGLIRRRLRFTFRRRRRGGFGFVRHSSRRHKPPAQRALRRTLTFISLRGRCQRGVRRIVTPNCHSERRDCFAKRSNPAVEESL